MEEIPCQDPAWSLVDAFDAVTNGMENPESFARLDMVIGEELQPWKHLVYAIKALYADDIPRCEAALEAMADDSPPAILKPLFRAWIHHGNNGDVPGNRDTLFAELSGACESVVQLYRRLLIEPHPLSLLAEQAEEALRHGLAEQFATMAGKILRALRDQSSRDGPLLALRYAQYCLELLDTGGYGDTDFFTAILKTLGEADGFCVLGFALIETDEAAAAAALKKALNAGDGRFLDRGMAALITEMLPLLETNTPLPAPHKPRVPEQQDLFGGVYG
jgi:hypothetical protein